MQINHDVDVVFDGPSESLTEKGWREKRYQLRERREERKRKELHEPS